MSSLEYAYGAAAVSSHIRGWSEGEILLFPRSWLMSVAGSGWMAYEGNRSYYSAAENIVRVFENVSLRESNVSSALQYFGFERILLSWCLVMSEEREDGAGR